VNRRKRKGSGKLAAVVQSTAGKDKDKLKLVCVAP